MKPAIDPKLRDDPLFRELLAEGLAMQERFSAKPVYANPNISHRGSRNQTNAHFHVAIAT